MLVQLQNLRDGAPTTGDLLISSGNPTAITVTAGCVNIVVRCGGEFDWCWAASASAGATAMGTTAFGRFSAGAYNFSPRGQTGKLCIRSTGAAVTNGLSYTQQFDNGGN